MPDPPSREKRKVWLMGAADWLKLSECLVLQDWSSLERIDPDEGASFLTETILQYARDCIPVKWICEKKSEHPWLNEKVLDLVQAKNDAESSALEAEALRACSEGILSEYQAWVAKTRDEISRLRRGSKQWWAKTRSLLAKSQKSTSIPALKNDEGQWVREAPQKANLFAATFSSKYKMPDEIHNEFSAIAPSGSSMNNERVPTLSGAIHVLEQLDPSSATGPDELPTRILRECATSLALPLLLLGC